VARGEPAPQAARPIQAKAATPAPAVAAPPVGANKPTRPAVIERTPSAPAEAVAAPSPARPAAPRHGFKASEFVVYPAHGVGQIVAIEEQEVAGFRLELFVITFVKDKMTLRVPVGKSASVGMRKLSDPDLVKRSLDTLLGRARIKRTMWSRRAQEYEAKINSGDLIAIAEVVRDLYRSEAQPEQSYSERQLYEAALDRMAREVAAVQKLSEGEALKALEAQLQRGQRRGKSEAAGPGEAGEADVEEAA
jgi:CarD family transcriptional regulator